MLSVVPDMLHSLVNCCRKYFKKDPFILQPGMKSGIKIKYRNPIDVGSDRIANSIAATSLYPNKNLIIIDFGTAVTFCAISKNCEYLGGVISAGIQISMKALEKNTAKTTKSRNHLPSINYRTFYSRKYSIWTLLWDS